MGAGFFELSAQLLKQFCLAFTVVLVTELSDAVIGITLEPDQTSEFADSETETPMNPIRSKLGQI